MFDNLKWDQLKLMYKILEKGDDCLKLIIQKMNPYLEARGNAIVQNEANLKDHMEFSKKLLAFKEEIDVAI